MEHIDNAILQTLSYFSFFSYAPSFEDIYTFLPVKTTKQALRAELNRMVHNNLLLKRHTKLSKIFNSEFFIFQSVIYTLPPHRIFLEKRLARMTISEKKIKKMRAVVRLFACVPSIELVGITGGLSMMNARSHHDIDLFIITRPQRLWTGRASAVATAEFFGVRRRRNDLVVRDRICCNLFFDASDLAVPVQKRNRYVAHEIVQMKPVISKHHIYERFLQANRWVTDFFPNKKIDITISNHVQKNTNHIGNFVEWLCKKIQLSFMNRHRTSELISDTQLWFFPKDFEKKMRKKGLLEV